MRTEDVEAMAVSLQRWTSRLRHRDAGAQKRIYGEAVEWFVSLHRDSLEDFDWTGFERWLLTDRRHRNSYDRLEALWYELEDLQRNGVPQACNDSTPIEPPRLVGSYG